MTSKYSVIVFDLGNVIIPFDYSIVVKRLNEIDAGLGERFYKIYMDNYHVYKSYERWQLSDEEFTSKMMEWTEGKVDREKFYDIYSNIFTVNENVVELIKKIKKNHKIVMLSNTCFIHQKYGWGKYEFLKVFDKWILSHEVGAVKPEEKIYRAVEEFTKVPSEKHFFIDDIAEYVEAAKRIGWGGTQFTGYKNLIAELKTLQII